MIKFDFNYSPLESYIEKSIKEIYDYFAFQNQRELIERKSEINKFIQFRRTEILGLDTNVKNNLTFISLLIDVSERLGLFSSFNYLYAHLMERQFNVGKRIDAASRFLIGVKTKDDYIGRLSEICELLQDAVENEEDSSDKILITFSNYYSQFVYHFGEFNPDAIRHLKSEISEIREERNYSFLSDKLVDQLLQIDECKPSAYDLIIQKVDLFFNTIDKKSIAFSESENQCLMEENTEYASLIEPASANFSEILKISQAKYSLVRDDEIFRSLGRGVSIIESENQLFAYMYGYGAMHAAKLQGAFSNLDDKEITPDFNIIDWGCGQGIGSMIFMENCSMLDLTLTPKRVILIEPSIICIKRAALHVSKYCSKTKITTINKEIDNLQDDDFHNELIGTNVHIFSNILDIDGFSISKLLNIIDKNFVGKNYFVCVSPYINDTRTSRLDIFMNHFSSNPCFKILKSIESKKGEWEKDWTRVIRIFCVNI